MLGMIFRGIFLIGILTWYSTSVWKMIDNYFKDQFQSYLEEEYRKNPRMKSDVQKHSAGKPDTVVTTPRPETTEAPTWKAEEVCEREFCPAEGVGNDAVLGGQPKEEENVVAGGTSENEATKRSTDENAFLEITPESGLESRSTSNNTHHEEPRDGPINHRFREQEKSEVSADQSTSPASEIARKKVTKHKRKTTYPSETPRKKQKVKTIFLTEKDFATARRNEVSDDDFWEFEEDAENREPQKGILVSELPFKPRADIGDLERVTADEYCPLTLEEESSCGETVKWP